MSVTHVTPEEMAAFAGLPPEHERRQHVESCALCRARWLDFQSFQSAEPLPVEARAGEARAVLSELIRKEFAPRHVPLPQRARFRAWPVRAGGGWLAAAAAVVLVASGAWWLAARNPSGTLRGPSAATTVPLAIQPVEWRGDSAIVLRWRSQPGASQYEVRLYGADMVERQRMDAGADSALELKTRLLPGDFRSGVGFAWRVVALREGAELGHSEFGAIRTP